MSKRRICQMNAQRNIEMFKKMLHQNVTVSSLVMFAKKIEKDSPEALITFLEMSCEMDIFKTATVVQQFLGENQNAAQEKVIQILTDRCKTADSFTALDLLAIATLEQSQLFKDSSVHFTKSIINATFNLANVHIACWLLRLSLESLPQETYKIIETAFCKFLVTNNTAIDEELSKLVPILVEYNTVNVLSVLIELVGIEQVEKFYGKPILPEINRMILLGEDSVIFWEVFLENFFATTRTPEELTEEGLWYIQLNASESIYDEVCAVFYFYVAANYGIEHPLFDYVEGFEPPKKYSRKHIMRYKDTIDSLWEQPEVLSQFLDKTKLCNPFLIEKSNRNSYELLENAEDPVNYGKLSRLFELNASPAEILNIFLSTNLKNSLPFEDVFYLAKRYEILPDFLEIVKDVPFLGIITKNIERSIFLLPLSYCVTAVHILNLPHQIDKRLDYNSKQKGMTMSYTIKDFREGHLRIAYCENFIEQSQNIETLMPWNASIEELRELLSFDEISLDQLQQLNILQFKRNDLLNQCDLNLFTRLFLEHPNQIYTFLKILDLANWNSGYSNKNWQIKKELYDDLKPYYEETFQLFKVLFATQNVGSVLEVYFSSIYKIILPLNELLFMADKNLLLDFLPKFTFSCHLKEQDSNLCRPKNILCAPICSVENTENIVASKPFYAYISDFTVFPTNIYRIVLTPCSATEVSVEERGSTFGYLSKNIPISDWRIDFISQFPSTADCNHREIRFNLVCMEDAILLRRSDCNSLMQLIQILKKANPFAFQVSAVADQIYLKQFLYKQNKSDTKISAITTMLLNAKDINCIRELYLNTYIKFYMSIPQFIQLIKERRPDLIDQIPTLFKDTVFYAIADEEGKLWMPWIKQNTLQIPKEYVGQFLHCTISIDTNGIIDANVIQTQQSDDFFDILKNCLLAGYNITPYMKTLRNEFLSLHDSDELKNEVAKKALSFDKKLSFEENHKVLKKKLYIKPFDSKEFAKNIGTLIRNYCHAVSAKEMENAISELTAIWIQRYPDTKKLRKYLFGTHLCFAGYYHSFGLGNIFVSQFYEYLYGKAAVSFEEKINDSIVRLTKDFENAPSFEQALSRIRESLQTKDFEYKTFSKQIQELIKNYKALVTIEEMTNGIADLTTEFIHLYPYSEDIKQPLLSILQTFKSTYKSGSLELKICEQVHKYSDEPQSLAFELSVKKTPSLPNNISNTSQNKPDSKKSNKATPTPSTPILSTLPFETNVKMIRQMIYEEDFEFKTFIKYLRKLIQKYNNLISEEEMLEAITNLFEQSLQQNENDTISKTFLLGIHTCFYSFYQSDKLGLALCKLANQYLNELQAADFVNSFIKLESKRNDLLTEERI